MRNGWLSFYKRIGEFINLSDFNPILPTGCRIAEMYGENPDLTQTRYITVIVKYRGFKFRLWYTLMPQYGILCVNVYNL